MVVEGDDAVKVLALTRYGRMGASSRMRFAQYVPGLRAVGVDVELAPLLRDEYLARLYAKRPTAWGQIIGDYVRRLVHVIRAGSFDLLWIEKELFPDLPAWFERLLRWSGVRYVVDYDDAIFHNYDLSSNPLRKMLRHKIDSVMRNAALVVAGNEYLAERARRAGAERVETLPTVVDLGRYSPAQKRESEEVVVGWVGSASTVKYLDIVVPALRQLAAERPLRLRVIGATFSANDLSVECREWSEADEGDQIRDFDIGIMPLIDSPWERGKCGYKLIQYMACGVPVIASPVGANCDIVEDGMSGFFAAGREEWANVLRVLAGGAALRRAMGARGRSVVEERYCLQVAAPRLAEYFSELREPGVRG